MIRRRRSMHRSRPRGVEILRQRGRRLLEKRTPRYVPAYDEVRVNSSECAAAVRMLWTADMGGGPEVVSIVFNEEIRPLLAQPNGSEQVLLEFIRVVRFLTVMAASGHGTTPSEIVQNVALIELSGGAVLEDDETEDDSDVD